MPLLDLGGIGVMGQGVLQSPELLARVAAEGVNGAPGKKHLALVEKLPPDGSEYKIMFRLQPSFFC